MVMPKHARALINLLAKLGLKEAINTKRQYSILRMQMLSNIRIDIDLAEGEPETIP